MARLPQASPKVPARDHHTVIDVSAFQMGGCHDPARRGLTQTRAEAMVNVYQSARRNRLTLVLNTSAKQAGQGPKLLHSLLSLEEMVLLRKYAKMIFNCWQAGQVIDHRWCLDLLQMLTPHFIAKSRSCTHSVSTICYLLEVKFAAFSTKQKLRYCHPEERRKLGGPSWAHQVI